MAGHAVRVRFLREVVLVVGNGKDDAGNMRDHSGEMWAFFWWRGGTARD